jgi:hypothetical protein
MARLCLRLGAASLVLLFASAVLRGGEKLELRWRFQKDQVHKYQLTHRDERTVAVGAQKLTTTTDTTFGWQWTVQDVDDQGVATLEHKLTSLRLSSNGKDFEFEYDSGRANQSDDGYKKKLIQFLDQVRFAGNYRVRLRPDGTLAEVHGFTKAVRDANPETNVADFYALNLQDETFGWFLQQALGTLPGRPVPRDGRWQTTANGKFGELGRITGRIDFRLAKPVTVDDRPCEVVSWQGEQALDLDTRWLNQALRGPLQSKRLSGELIFDAKAGALRSSKADVELQGNLKWGDGQVDLRVSYRHTLELTRTP